MSKDKLNKIASMYTSAMSEGVKPRETDAEKDLKESKKKRSKKLEFSEEEASEDQE